MTRRDALIRLAALFGGTVFGASRFLAGTANAADASTAALLTADDLALLNAVGETIIPATPGSGGAAAANIAEFMQEIVRDFYDNQERTTFVKGIATLREAARTNNPGRTFASLPAVERHKLLLAFDRAEPQPDSYRMMKQLTTWGYFTSEVGATQALTYVPVPGRYEGCITVAPGTKAWAD